MCCLSSCLFAFSNIPVGISEKKKKKKPRAVFLGEASELRQWPRGAAAALHSWHASAASLPEKKKGIDCLNCFAKNCRELSVDLALLFAFPMVVVCTGTLGIAAGVAFWFLEQYCAMCMLCFCGWGQSCHLKAWEPESLYFFFFYFFNPDYVVFRGKCKQHLEDVECYFTGLCAYAQDPPSWIQPWQLELRPCKVWAEQLHAAGTAVDAAECFQSQTKSHWVEFKKINSLKWSGVSWTSSRFG